MAHLRQEGSRNDEQDAENKVAEGDGWERGIIIQRDGLAHNEGKLGDLKVIVSCFFHSRSVVDGIVCRRQLGFRGISVDSLVLGNRCA
jgi:hypothetical protein